MAVLVNLPMDPDDSLSIAERFLYTIVPLAGVWVLVLRPQVVVLDNEIVVIQWRRTIRFQAALLVGVAFDYYGTDLELSDGQVVRTDTLQRPNWAAWTGKKSRADRITYELLCHAAAKRGEPKPEPAGSRRSTGDVSGGVFAAIGATLGAMFNSIR